MMITPAKHIPYALNAAAFAMRELDFHPDPTQTTILEANPRRLLLNCNRQWGKSTISAILIAHRAIFKPGSLSIILAPSKRQSAETLRKVAEFLEKAGLPVLKSDRVNQHSIVLPNGSRIIALPSSESKLRGFSAVSLLVIDEAARVEDPLYYALRPALAVSAGDIVCVTTPLGKRGFYYREYAFNKDWVKYTIPASQCPRISNAFLDEERRLGDEYFSQEYECQFVESGRFLLNDADCGRLFTTDIQPLNLYDPRVPAWTNTMRPLVPPRNPERSE